MRRDISDAIQTAILRLDSKDFRKDMPSEVLDEVDTLCCEHGDDETLKAISDIQTQLAGNDPNIPEAIASLKRLIGMSEVEIEDDTAEAHLHEDIIGGLPSPHTEESPHRRIPDPTAALIDQPTMGSPPAISFSTIVTRDREDVDPEDEEMMEAEAPERSEPVESTEPLVKNERSIAQAALIVTLVALSVAIVISFGAFTLAAMKNERTEASVADVTHTVQSEPKAKPSTETVEAQPIKVQLPLTPLPAGQRIDCRYAKEFGNSLLIKVNGELWLVESMAKNENVCVFKNGPHANQPVPATCFNEEADDRICPKRKKL